MLTLTLLLQIVMSTYNSLNSIDNYRFPYVTG